MIPPHFLRSQKKPILLTKPVLVCSQLSEVDTLNESFELLDADTDEQEKEKENTQDPRQVKF